MLNIHLFMAMFAPGYSFLNEGIGESVWVYIPLLEIVPERVAHLAFLTASCNAGQ